jgi:hypothetical protein
VQEKFEDNTDVIKSRKIEEQTKQWPQDNEQNDK